jgi:hypothetical protein
MASTSELFSWAQSHAGAGAITQSVLLCLVCALTWFDPLVRRDRTTAGIAIGGWVFMAIVGGWRSAFVENPSGVVAWGVAALYLLIVFATLGRPLLMLSDLLEEKEEEEDDFQLPQNLRRRSRAAQATVIVGVVAGLFAVFYL